MNEHDCEQTVEHTSGKAHRVAYVYWATDQFHPQTLVINEDTKEHLHHLQGCDRDTHSLRNVHMHCLEGVVAVHERMHQEIHVNHPTGRGWHVRKHEPEKDKRGRR